MQIWTPSWQPLRPFALELIVEKSLASAGLPLSPGDGLRRVFESISGGCILQVNIVFDFTKKMSQNFSFHEKNLTQNFWFHYYILVSRKNWLYDFFQGSPGLLDPCEKDAKDVLDNLTNQERENLTSHAQKSLRLIAFRQVHQVLDMEQLIPNKYTGRGKKRPHTSGGSSGTNAGALQNGGGTDEPSAKAIKHEAKDNNWSLSSHLCASIFREINFTNIKNSSEYHYNLFQIYFLIFFVFGLLWTHMHLFRDWKQKLNFADDGKILK